MAERKTTATNKTTASTKTQKSKNEAVNDNIVMNITTAPASALTVIEEDLNLDAKVTVKNLAGWDVTFARLQDGYGDVVIVANGQQRLSRNEVIAQVNNNNKLFTGSDTVGSHATVYIDDVATRRWVGFEDEDRPQKIFTEKLVKDLFDMSQDRYETELPKYIRTRAEKYALIETIKKLRLNDYAKMVFASEYTGYKL